MPIRLRASAAPIWANCPASTRLPQLPREDTPESLEGDAVHALAAGVAPPAGVNITPEMEATAREFVEFTRGLGCDQGGHEIKLSGASGELVSITGGSRGEPWGHGLTFSGGSLPPGVEGTADFIGWGSSSRTLHVVDLKYGFLPVSPKRNWQLIVYSLGARDYFKGVDPVRVEFHVYQPRDFSSRSPVKSWAVTGDEWRKLITGLYNRVRAAKKFTDAVTGDHCQYCLSRTHCPAFLTSAASILETTIPQAESVDLTPEAMGAAYAYAVRAEAIAKAARAGLEDSIIHRIKTKSPVPGWTLSRGPGARRWSATLDEIKAVSGMIGVPLIEEKPISVTVADKNAAIRPAIASLMTRGEGKLKLVPFDGDKTGEVFND